MKIEEELDGRFRNNYHKGVINLIYTTSLITTGFNQSVKEQGLSIQQYNILKILRGFGNEPRSIDFIKKRMLDKQSDVSRIIDRLYLKKLVDRKESKCDRRQKDIVITKKGMELLSAMDNIEHEIDKLLKNLSEAEVESLNNILDKIRE